MPPAQQVEQPAAAPAESPPPEKPITDPPQPRHQQNKEAARADLNSLREVANLSARSAIATHTGKQLRGKALIKCILSAVAFGVGAVLLTGNIWGSRSYTAYGFAALAIGGIMGLDLLLATLGFVRTKTSLNESDADTTQEA